MLGDMCAMSPAHVGVSNNEYSEAILIYQGTVGWDTFGQVHFVRNKRISFLSEHMIQRKSGSYPDLFRRLAVKSSLSSSRLQNTPLVRNGSETLLLPGDTSGFRGQSRPTECRFYHLELPGPPKLVRWSGKSKQRVRKRT